ncbi:MAG: hypothetical protein A2340_02820 [Lentisphaerae bacterium RIFOXYB12_FULL_60_10]|nr:MAG: hypothetical protein A2340_02820 [Lentisphaerae bacterium RIFOXYB12_FULL_60_10]
MSTQSKSLSNAVVPCTPNRILVVDDEKSIREIFFQVLSYGIKDCRLDLAVNGLEAVNMFREVHHAVLLMDLRMPVMDGKEAFDAIRQYCADNHWEMPAVVFCTGYATPYDVSAIVSASPKHCVLQKPVGNEVLVEVLKTRLKGGW